jgi:S-DNA-T family DNA segregation ATPase FtsK/SpoIIIE
MVATLFLILALVSYSPSDLSDNTAFRGQGSPRSANLMGLLGAKTADWAVQALGCVAYTIPMVTLWLGFVLFGSRRSLGRIAAAGLLALLLQVDLALLTALVFERGDPIHPLLSSGGAVGTLLRGWVVLWLNRWGGMLLSFTLLVLTAVAVTKVSVAAVASRAATGVAVSTRGAAGLVRSMAGRVRRPALADDDDLPAGREEGAEEAPPPPKRKRSPEPSRSPSREREEEKEVPIVGLHRRMGKGETRQETLALAPRVGGFTLPPLTLLDPPPPPTAGDSRAEIQNKSQLLVKKLRDFQVEGEVVKVHPGPVVTLFEFKPAPGVKLTRIVNLADDLSLALSAKSIRIIAPIPGKAVVGVEVSNNRREVVSLREVLESEPFRTSALRLPMALGKDVFGNPFVTDLAEMPHLLVAGATGSGKSVLVNSLICSILFQFPPDRVKFLMIDPKMVELSTYDRIPHQIHPVVTHPKQAAAALRNITTIMEDRYQLMAQLGVRNLESYNRLVAEGKQGPDGAPLTPVPYLLVVIDELADLMIMAGNQVEDSIMRLAQTARAVGIHLILATQRPSVNVITGVIKANLPARIAFQVSSKTDSRTILDANGAEQLLGKGDMLFLLPGTSVPTRVHGCYVSDGEVHRVVSYWQQQGKPDYDLALARDEEDGEGTEGEEIDDERYRDAVEMVMRTKQVSVSMIQRKMRLGYNRAARIVERMEREGIVSPADGVRPRRVLKPGGGE